MIYHLILYQIILKPKNIYLLRETMKLHSHFMVQYQMYLFFQKQSLILIQYFHHLYLEKDKKKIYFYQIDLVRLYYQEWEQSLSQPYYYKLALQCNQNDYQRH